MSTIDRQIAMMFAYLGKTMPAYINQQDDVKKAIINNSIGAAASSLASGFLPGVGAMAATAVSVGFIWRMYYQINKALGISLSKNVLKSVASALLANLVTGLGGVVIIEVTAVTLSLIPGIGSLSAAVLLATVNYGLVYVSGLVYIKMLTGLFKANKDISSMTLDEIKATAKNTFEQNKSEFKSAFDTAREDAKKDIKSGKISKEDSFDPEKD